MLRLLSAVVYNIGVKFSIFNIYYESVIMRLLLALIFPWAVFFTIGRPFAGIVCLILQLTVIGWIPATIWAIYALGQYKTDVKLSKLKAEITKQK